MVVVLVTVVVQRVTDGREARGPWLAPSWLLDVGVGRCVQSALVSGSQIGVSGRWLLWCLGPPNKQPWLEGQVAVTVTIRLTQSDTSRGGANIKVK